MKYFTREWWAGGCEDADVVVALYEKYLATVRPKLPSKLVELEAEYTLHDSEVKNIKVDFGSSSVTLALHGWDAQLQNKIRYELYFSGTSEFVQAFPPQDFVESELGDLAYWECELLESCIEVRMLFVSNAQFTIRFTDFSFTHSHREA